MVPRKECAIQEAKDRTESPRNEIKDIFKNTRVNAMLLKLQKNPIYKKTKRIELEKKQNAVTVRTTNTSKKAGACSRTRTPQNKRTS